MAVKIKHFIGIDVSKEKIDCVLLKDSILIGHKVVSNDLNSITNYLNAFRQLKGYSIQNTLFCMEETGIYTDILKRVLEKIRAKFVIENAYHIKTSLGIKRAKTDELDAYHIALYAYKNRDHLKVYSSKRPILETLQHLESLRTRLMSIRVVLDNPLGEQKKYFTKSQYQDQLALTHDCRNSIIKGYESVNKKIEEIMSRDLLLSHLMFIVTSVTGIGPVTARHIIISTNEFKKINDPRKYACYAGVAPFKRSSGNIEYKSKISKIANQKVKSLLTMCAMSAIKTDADLKDYYIRKTTVDGKSKLSVINAVRYKLILRVFACVKHDRKYVR